MARQRKKHHFWRNLLILIVLFGIYLYWGNSSIETDEATFTSGALPAGFDGCLPHRAAQRSAWQILRQG